MSDDWTERVAAFWARFDDADADAMVAEMKALVDERLGDDERADDAEALYEWASAHDSVGRESEAVPLYRRALAAGLDGDLYPRCLIQFASTLRNVGELDESIELLRSVPENAATGDAASAFLALSLHDAGRTSEAVRVALTALAPTLPRYGRAVRAYAEELSEDPDR